MAPVKALTAATAATAGFCLLLAIVQVRAAVFMRHGPSRAPGGGRRAAPGCAGGPALVTAAAFGALGAEGAQGDGRATAAGRPAQDAREQSARGWCCLVSWLSSGTQQPQHSWYPHTSALRLHAGTCWVRAQETGSAQTGATRAERVRYREWGADTVVARVASPAGMGAGPVNLGCGGEGQRGICR